MAAGEQLGLMDGGDERAAGHRLRQLEAVDLGVERLAFVRELIDGARQPVGDADDAQGVFAHLGDLFGDGRVAFLQNALRGSQLVDGGGELEHRVRQVPVRLGLALAALGGSLRGARHVLRLAHELFAFVHLLVRQARDVLQSARDLLRRVDHARALRGEAGGLGDGGLDGRERARGDDANLFEGGSGAIALLNSGGRGFAALADELDGLLHAVAHGLHELKNLARAAGGALGERADLGGDDAERLAALAGLVRDDGGVERQQVRLVGDLLNHVDHAADLEALRAQAVDEHGRAAHRFVDAVHAPNAGDDEALALLGGGSDLAGEVAGLVCAAANRVDAALDGLHVLFGFFGEAHQRVAGGCDLGRAAAHRLGALRGLRRRGNERCSSACRDVLDPLGHL